MTNRREEPIGESSGSSQIHTVQPERDLEANWEVNLAKKLEEYLLKICSGEISGSEDDGQVHVNFAEAALLLQGSVQVYSRKVEYLYNLVLHALEFLSQKREQDQSEGAAVQHEGSGSHAASDEENDLFWVLDGIPVEAKNCIDSSTAIDVSLNNFVKPPANLVVLEGDCLDTTGDGGELESYLLATNDLYRDFILLDPCDAVAINDFLKGDEAGKRQNGAHLGTSAHKSFLSPTRYSGGSARKSFVGKNEDANLNRSPGVDYTFDDTNCDMGPNPPAYGCFEDNGHGFDMDNRYTEARDLDDSEDDDDPWKPLNPHEPGNLKVKPFRKVKSFRRNGMISTKRISITTLFPLARLQGTISPDLTKMWETQQNAFEREMDSQPPSLYEKLRQSLTNEGRQPCHDFGSPEDDNEDNEFGCGVPDFDMPDHMSMDEDAPLNHEKHDGDDASFDNAFGHGDSYSQANLEDLCRSHLDALLASIAENEKQTELATRVSSWKQKIEQNLEEQDSRPQFDIRDYGERILGKLSVEADNGTAMSFAEVVKGQEKHEVARTFSALLQLVNNGDVDLEKTKANGRSVCYTAENPFHIRLLSRDNREGKTQFRLSKKRVKSPSGKGPIRGVRRKSGRGKSPMVSSSPEDESTAKSFQLNSNFPVKLGKIGGTRCTPDGKRRRRSQIVEAVDLHSAR
ncbi:DUF1032 domain-containing protein [Cephalotus follicularis]|uniref:Condensin-2 complex subunit H2 n=1 Tax=Cephalotus follicularis TaxID=3775 RepID=A0A1Q3B834_CEPFO|nr:DUF1032 domain-containing protein [Cephalotus follicularis]